MCCDRFLAVQLLCCAISVFMSEGKVTKLYVCVCVCVNMIKHTKNKNRTQLFRHERNISLPSCMLQFLIVVTTHANYIYIQRAD